MTDCPALVGLSEAAEILGVAKQNVHRLKDMPSSLQKRDPGRYRVRSGPVWLEDDIRAFAEDRAKAKL